MSDAPPRPVNWIGSSYKDFRAFPGDVQGEMGYSLHLAQTGRKHDDAKPPKGFGRAGVLEIVSDHVSDTYLPVYSVKISMAVYVLHAVQKKAKTGIKTPTSDLEMIERRLKLAEADHKATQAEGT
jgi:phage-related protein